MMPTMQALAMRPPTQYQGLAGMAVRNPAAFAAGPMNQAWAQFVQRQARPLPPRNQLPPQYSQSPPQMMAQRMPPPQQPMAVQARPAQMPAELQSALHTLQVGGAAALTPEQVTLLNAHKGNMR